ncbi:MAG: GIY-YIG nuclease family protein [Gammaproteobacteria bacterium]|jgi:putative endonuclease
MSWIIYILECSDGSLYTGITNNLTKRLTAHSNGHGAKYTKGRGPLEHVYSETAVDRSAAQKRESSIKKLSRAEKIRLISTSALLSRT